MDDDLPSPLTAPAPPAAPVPDRRQRVRLFRHAMGAVSSLLIVVLVYVHAGSGVIPVSVAHVFAVTVLGIVLAFTLCFATGLNKRFADPSLTGPQILSAGIALAYLANAAPDFRALELTFYVVAMLFGAFRLSTGQLAGVGAFFLVTYLVAISLEPVGGSTSAQQPGKVLVALQLGAVLGWLAWLGGYISHVRKKLRTTNSELRAALDHIEKIATYDELTGVYNRRAINEIVERERQRAARYGASLSIAMVDADHFKRINDTYGHVAGDRVLQMLGDTLRSRLRESDAVGRYGGEEFLLVLPNTGRDGATVPLERLRQAISDMAVPGLPDVQATVSIGLAQHEDNEPSADTLKRADAAVYQAKAEGRNRVVIA